MLKSWILFVLTAIGLVVVALWAFRKLNPSSTIDLGFIEKIPLFNNSKPPLVSVSTDDPNMEIPDFDSNKPVWNLNDDNNRALTTTYIRKD